MHERLAFQGIGGVRLAADRWDPPGGDPRGTVLLLHGGGQTRHSWRTTGRALADRGWSTVALDARGHGESDWAPDGDYSLDAQVGDVRAVVDDLGERPVLVGASMGGMTAMVAEGEQPGSARGLVLVDVTPRLEPDGVREITTFMRTGAEGFADLAEAADAIAAYNPGRPRPRSTDGLRKNLRLRDGRWYWHWDPRFIDGGGDPEHRGPEYRSRELARRSHRVHGAAARVVAPTLLVRGAQSTVVSARGAAELRDLIPHAAQVDVAGAGHMVTGDDNDVFSAAVLGFLDTAVAPRPVRPPAVNGRPSTP